MDNNYKVYKHKCIINSKVYIGITLQKPDRRWRNGRGYKRNSYFYRAIQKYGWDNFEHIVLFDRLSKQEAEDIEIELIAFHKSNDKQFGYNISNGGNTIGTHSLATRQKMKDNHYDCKGKNGSFYGKHHTKEAKLKMSLAKKGKYCGELNHNYGKTFSAETKLKLSIARKGKYCGKDNPNYGKHHKHSEETKKKLSELSSGKNNPMYGRHGIDNPNSIKIICLNTLKIYNSIKEASNELNVFANGISRVCKGKQSHCGGYKFMYLEDYNKTIEN